MNFERDPDVQQVITALKQIASEPHRFHPNFHYKALIAAVDLLEIAYPRPTRPPKPQMPGQLDIHQAMTR